MIIPRWAQVRQMPRFLSKKEKNILLAFFFLAIISVGYFAITSYFEHTVLVPAYRGSYTEGMLGNPRFINPLFLSESQVDRDIASLVFSGLMKHDANGMLANDLAEKLEVGEEGKTYVVALRHGVVWHDGENFTADDVLYTIEKFQDPDYRSNLRTTFKDIRVEKIDDYAVRFTLPAPNYLFPEMLTFGVIPRHIFQDIDVKEITTDIVNLRPVGTGPYQFKSLTKEDDERIVSYTLSVNSDYYAKKPYLKTIEFRFYPNADDLRIAAMKGEVEGISSLTLETFEKLDPKEFSLYRLKIPRYFALFLNQAKNKALSEAAVRTAIDRAIDRNAIIANTVRGEAELESRAIPSFLLERGESAENAGFNLDEAKKILEENGWKEKDGVRTKTFVDKNKKKEEVRLEAEFVTSESPELTSIASVLASQLQALGMKVAIKSVPVEDLGQEYVKTRKYDALLFGEIVGLDPDLYLFWHSSFKKYPGLNLSLYENKAADTLLEQIRVTKDRDERNIKNKALENIIEKDHPAIFLYSPYYLFAMTSEMRGIHVNIAGLPNERFNTISEWYSDLKRVWK